MSVGANAGFMGFNGILRIVVFKNKTYPTNRPPILPIPRFVSLLHPLASQSHELNTGESRES